MDIPTALTSVSTALGIVSALRNIEKDFDAASFKLHVADLASQLADAKIALLELQDVMQQKDRELARLKDSFAVKETLVHQGGFDFIPDSDGGIHGYAVCPRCLGVDGRIMRLVRGVLDGRRIATCPQCKQNFDSHDAYAG